MSFRSWRGKKLLSQERVAEMSGLSPVQRLEAGHRVSYASLRALATAFVVDVDSLERELYAMNKSVDDFVEVPRWVRLLSDGLWSKGPSPSRRDAHLTEAFLIGLGVIFLIASFLVRSDVLVNIFRIGAVFEIACGYLVSIVSRVLDAYRVWPSSGSAPRESDQATPRGWRARVAEYAFALGVGALLIVITCVVAF